MQAKNLEAKSRPGRWGLRPLGVRGDNSVRAEEKQLASLVAYHSPSRHPSCSLVKATSITKPTLLGLIHLKPIPVAKLYGRSFRSVANSKYVKQTLPVLTNLEERPDSNHETAYAYGIILGEGSSSRILDLELRPLLTKDQPLDQPHFIDKANIVVFFAGTLFLFDPPPANAQEKETALLMVKKSVLSVHVSTAKLRSEIAALEAIVSREHQPSRRPIPDAVKRAVWVRDQGRCIACGCTNDLQFDHVIPYSKGGGDSEQNLQIMCGKCNRAKSARI